MEMLKLMAPVVKRAKDAARTIKQKTDLVVKKVTDKALTEMLDLPSLKVTGYSVEEEEAGEIVHVYSELTIEVGVCPLCKTISSNIKSRKERCVRDLDWSGKRVFIHFGIRRFECGECGHRFTEELEAVAWRRHQTLRFEQEVYKRCLDSSQKAVAKALHLSRSTVKGIFIRYAKKYQRRQHFGTVRVLGMDEIALKKRHKQYVLVLSDLERRYVLTILPSREQAALKRWLTTLSDTQKQTIAVVSMDMWRPYRAFVETWLPHAQIVADRFHVMKHLNDQLSKARRQIQRQADEPTKAALKGCRWLLLYAGSSLSDEQAAKLALALTADPDLRTAYLLKEEFRLIFVRISDRHKARRFLEAWICKVYFSNNRYLLDFVRTLLNWFEQILAYFDDRISNGFVEGINRAIRAIISRAYGFRNFDNFKLTVLALHGHPVSYTLSP